VIDRLSDIPHISWYSRIRDTLDSQCHVAAFRWLW